MADLTPTEYHRGDRVRFRDGVIGGKFHSTFGAREVGTVERITSCRVHVQFPSRKKPVYVLAANLELAPAASSTP